MSSFIFLISSMITIAYRSINSVQIYAMFNLIMLMISFLSICIGIGNVLTGNLSIFVGIITPTIACSINIFLIYIINSHMTYISIEDDEFKGSSTEYD